MVDLHDHLSDLGLIDYDDTPEEVAAYIKELELRLLTAQDRIATIESYGKARIKELEAQKEVAYAEVEAQVRKRKELEAEVKAWREKFPAAGFDGNSLVLSG